MKAMDDIHKKVLRKFHTLCSMTGLNADEKMAIVESYGVESSADIDTHDLLNICAALERKIAGNQPDLDHLRKQVMAAIGGYLRAVHKEGGAEMIKGIACRATGYGNFNKIPSERLRNLYNAFRNKQKDIAAVDTLTDSMLYSSFIDISAARQVN